MNILIVDFLSYYFPVENYCTCGVEKYTLKYHETMHQKY